MKWPIIQLWLTIYFNKLVNKGITFAAFHCSGKIPDDIERLNQWCRGRGEARTQSPPIVETRRKLPILSEIVRKVVDSGGGGQGEEGWRFKMLSSGKVFVCGKMFSVRRKSSALAPTTKKNKTPKNKKTWVPRRHWVNQIRKSTGYIICTNHNNYIAYTIWTTCFTNITPRRRLFNSYSVAITFDKITEHWIRNSRSTIINGILTTK